MTELEYEKSQRLLDISLFYNGSDEHIWQQKEEVEIEVNDDLSVTIIRDSNGAMEQFLERFRKRYINPMFINKKESE